MDMDPEREITEIFNSFPFPKVIHPKTFVKCLCAPSIWFSVWSYRDKDCSSVKSEDYSVNSFSQLS